MNRTSLCTCLLALMTPSLLLGPGCGGMPTIDVPTLGPIRNPFADTPSPISELNDQQIVATGKVVTVALAYATPAIVKQIDDRDTRQAATLAIPLAAAGATWIATEAVERRREQYESEIALLDEEIAEAEKTLAAKQAELDSLEKAVADLQREIDTLIAQAQTDVEARQKAEATRKTLEGQIEQNNAAIVRYNQTIQYIDALLEDKEQIETQTQELEQRHVTLLEQRERFVAQRDQLYALIVNQEQQYNQLEALAMGRD